MAREKKHVNLVEPDKKTVKNSTANSIPAKRRCCFCLWLLLCILIFSAWQTYRTFWWGGPPEVAIPDVPYDLNGLDTPTRTSTGASGSAASGGTVPQGSVSTTGADTNSAATAVPATVSAFNPLEFFIEVATTYQTKSGTSKRWVKNPVYIGGKESDFSSLYSTCLNQVIDGFNANSPEVKMVRNAEAADIKIYWVTQEELSTRYNTDTGRPYATRSTDDGRIYAATIIMPIDGDFVDDLKCYIIKHEVMHALGFGHSDQTSYSLMGMPTLGKNITNGITDVDARIIRMLYASGLSLEQNADQIRSYFNNHGY